VNKAIL